MTFLSTSSFIGSSNWRVRGADFGNAEYKAMMQFLRSIECKIVTHWIDTRFEGEILVEVIQFGKRYLVGSAEGEISIR